MDDKNGDISGTRMHNDSLHVIREMMYLRMTSKQEVNVLGLNNYFGYVLCDN